MRFNAIRLAIDEMLMARRKMIKDSTVAEEQAEVQRIDALIESTEWRPNSNWLNDLPNLLCGPIVRKVLPEEVTVWLVLKTKTTVTLTVFERLPDGTQGDPVFSGSRETARIGEHLHVVAVTARKDAASERLVHGSIYYYDLKLSDSETLANHREDLVYGEEPLPSFMVPPLDLNDLRILHGSCRNVKGDGYDATPNLHHLLDKSYDKVAKNWTKNRPHQLFLTGDQIYADEGTDILLNLVGEAGDALLAGFNDNALNWQEVLPIPDNLIRIDQSNKISASTEGETFKNPSKLYPGLRTVREQELCLGDRDTKEPFDLLTEGLKFTAKSGNHLFGLGEFFANYLLVWSDKVWTGIFRDDRFALQMAKLREIFLAAEKAKSDDDRDEDTRIAEALFGQDYFNVLPQNEALFNKYVDWFHLAVINNPAFHDATKLEDAKKAAAKKIAEGFVRQIKEFFAFTITAQGVKKVRRGLANIPTYMMFDDHEVTDDWHMTMDWVKEVYASPIAKRVIQNALSAFAIFQAWGNTPERFEQDEPGKKFLDAIQGWISAEMSLDQLGNLVLERVVPCKLTANNEVETIPLLEDGALIGSEKSIRWDYRLSFGKYEAIATDARTRRAFTRRTLAPAEHLSKEAIKFQAPDTQGAEFDHEFTMVVSPCNIVTIPDFRKGFVGTALPLKVGVSNIHKLLKLGSVQKASIFNYDPDFADSWVVAEEPFERLIARLAARMPIVANKRLPARIIVLSGDVHFSATSRLQYWAEKPFGETAAITDMVMAHLVSSGLKNENGFWYMLHHLGFELLDFDEEKRLPKTEVLAGYGKKVSELTDAELEKRKELIEKTRWYPNYRVKMFAPAEESAPSLLPYHQTDPLVTIPKPEWFYRIDHMRGKKPKPPEPDLHKFENHDGTLEKFVKNQNEYMKYGKNFAPGLELIATNSIAELTFGWEGKGTLPEAINANTTEFVIKVDTPFPRTPFQIIAGNELILVSKIESLGLDLRVLECKRGLAKTTKAVHAAGDEVRVRKLVSQTHWLAKAKDEKKLPTSIEEVECVEFTRFDITLELEDLEFPKPALNI